MCLAPYIYIYNPLLIRDPDGGEKTHQITTALGCNRTVQILKAHTRVKMAIRVDSKHHTRVKLIIRVKTLTPNLLQHYSDDYNRRERMRDNWKNKNEEGQIDEEEDDFEPAQT